MNSFPPFPNAPSSSAKASSSSNAQLRSPASSKTLPSQPVPTPPPRDENIDLLQGLEANEALMKLYGYSVCADPKPSKLTHKRQRQAKNPRINPSAPSPLLNPHVLLSTRSLTLKGVNTSFAWLLQESLTWI